MIYNENTARKLKHVFDSEGMELFTVARRQKLWYNGSGRGGAARVDRIEWHPGFQAGIELRLRAYKSKLSYRHEYPLTRKPIVVDTLVIEKEDNVAIADDVAAIFLKYNIFEYKSPDDALSIDEY